MRSIYVSSSTFRIRSKHISMDSGPDESSLISLGPESVDALQVSPSRLSDLPIYCHRDPAPPRPRSIPHGIEFLKHRMTVFASQEYGNIDNARARERRPASDKSNCGRDRPEALFSG
jgi:hypothetical protein